MLNIIRGVSQNHQKLFPITASLIHTTSQSNAAKPPTVYDEFEQPYTRNNIKNLEDLGIAKSTWSWPKYNRIIYPPQSKDEPRRNAFVHHMRNYIKYSPWKLWFPAVMIRGMTIDEAIKQMTFHNSKGAKYIKETLIEAQELAVREHNVEFKSNLWVSYSDVGKANVVKGIRKHKGPDFKIVEYKYSHYYVRLEEGNPPVDYKPVKYKSFDERSEEYLQRLRDRKILFSL